MREHTHLAAVVSFVSHHVAQHFRAHRPWLGPAVPVKLLDAALATAERLRQHFHTSSGAFGQARTGLLWRAVRAVELCRNLQLRSGKPDPLTAHIVYVRENRRNGPRLAGWFGSPRSRVQMFNQHLVHAIIGGKSLRRCSARLGLNLGWTLAHGSGSSLEESSMVLQ